MATRRFGNLDRRVSNPWVEVELLRLLNDRKDHVDLRTIRDLSLREIEDAIKLHRSSHLGPYPLAAGRHLVDH